MLPKNMTMHANQIVVRLEKKTATTIYQRDLAIEYAFTIDKTEGRLTKKQLKTAGVKNC